MYTKECLNGRLFSSVARHIQDRRYRHSVDAVTFVLINTPPLSFSCSTPARALLGAADAACDGGTFQLPKGLYQHEQCGLYPSVVGSPPHVTQPPTQSDVFYHFQIITFIFERRKANSGQFYCESVLCPVILRVRFCQLNR